MVKVQRPSGVIERCLHLHMVPAVIWRGGRELRVILPAQERSLLSGKVLQPVPVLQSF